MEIVFGKIEYLNIGHNNEIAKKVDNGYFPHYVSGSMMAETVVQ